MTGFKTGSLVSWYIRVFAFGLILYGISCAPGYLWQDSGLIQYRVLNNDTEGFFGLAIAHPLYYWLTIPLKYLLPDYFPYAINLLSAVAGAVAVANVFLLVALWGGAVTPLPGLVASLCLAVSHTFWRHASIAETYTLWAALFTTELLFLQSFHAKGNKDSLLGLACVNGLAMSVHTLAVIPLACYVVFILRSWLKCYVSLSTVLKMLVMWFLGCLPLILLVVARCILSGDIVATFESLAYGDHWRESVLNTNVTWEIIKENLFYIGLNYPTPLLLLSLIGFASLFRIMRRGKSFRQTLLGLTVLFLIFAFRYPVPDRYAFFIPFYICLAIAMGIGVKAVLTRFPNRGLAVAAVLCSLLPVVVYPLLPTVLEEANISLNTRGDVPYRDDFRYFLFPWKTGYHGAERFAHEALETADRNAVIFADATTVGPLLTVQQHQKLRPDVHIVSAVVCSKNAPVFNQETVGPLLQKQSVYITSVRPGYYPNYIPKHYKFTEKGVLWKINKE